MVPHWVRGVETGRIVAPFLPDARDHGARRARAYAEQGIEAEVIEARTSTR